MPNRTKLRGKYKVRISKIILGLIRTKKSANKDLNSAIRHPEQVQQSGRHRFHTKQLFLVRKGLVTTTQRQGLALVLGTVCC